MPSVQVPASPPPLSNKDTYNLWPGGFVARIQGGRKKKATRKSRRTKRAQKTRKCGSWRR